LGFAPPSYLHAVPRRHSLTMTRMVTSPQGLPTIMARRPDEKNRRLGRRRLGQQRDASRTVRRAASA
jgi:hypothetical protein